MCIVCTRNKCVRAKLEVWSKFRYNFIGVDFEVPLQSVDLIEVSIAIIHTFWYSACMQLTCSEVYKFNASAVKTNFSSETMGLKGI